MLDIIEVGNQCYVRADSSFADQQTRVLMSGNMFGVFDRRGDFRIILTKGQGLFYKEMRHLSRFALRLKEGQLLLLSSAVQLDNAVFGVDFTNGELEQSDQKTLPAGTLHFYRANFVWENCCYQRIEIHNYSIESIAVELIVDFEADFADIFEVRGHQRERRGQLLEPRVEESAVSLEYLGLDGVRRETRIELRGAPAVEETIVFLSEREAADQLLTRGSEMAKVEIDSSNERFNDWVHRSLADLRMLVATTREGIYPYAGVPWYSTIFGRDGIITALECLWACPEVAQGVLYHLAATQATAVDPGQDAEPGKILHEARQSEMARAGEVPFGRYYGSVDSTPLFILLAARISNAPGTGN
jgi:glycogen debranching enzyme